jgi:hypothetical protein
MTSFVLLQPKAWECRAARVTRREALDDAKHGLKRRIEETKRLRKKAAASRRNEGWQQASHEKRSEQADAWTQP